MRKILFPLAIAVYMLNITAIETYATPCPSQDTLRRLSTSLAERLKNVQPTAPDTTQVSGEPGYHGDYWISCCCSPRPSPSILLFVDGREIDNLDLVDIEQIIDFRIFKDEKYTKPYGEKAKDGIVIVSTKQRFLPHYGTRAALSAIPDNGMKPANTALPSLFSANPMYIVDGVPVESVKNILLDRIKDVHILKDMNLNLCSHPRNGVVVVTTYTENEYAIIHRLGLMSPKERPRIVVDMEEVSYAEFKKMDKSTIESMEWHDRDNGFFASYDEDSNPLRQFMQP